MPTPIEITELQKLIAGASDERLLPVGARTKSALTAEVERGSATPISSEALRGIVAYDPSEFLMTVRSGTLLSEIQATLADNGQYMPFDPQYIEQGSTIGGTVASGINGPNCLLYGGLRDFLMEVEFIDGLGKLVVGGGKVVKNAAGFDLPKLIVGSYGRLCFLTEITLKVLPRPQAVVKCETEFPSLPACIKAIQKLRRLPLPITAIDFTEQGKLTVLFAGPTDGLEAAVQKSTKTMEHEWKTHPMFQSSDGPQLTSPSAAIQVRVAMDVANCPQLVSLIQNMPHVEIQTFTCGGSIALLSAASLNSLEEIDLGLSSLGLSGVAIQGPVGGLTVLGDRKWVGPASRIQQAMDPKSRFIGFPDNATTPRV